jgi:hypothetical protein
MSIHNYLNTYMRIKVWAKKLNLVARITSRLLDGRLKQFGENWQSKKLRGFLKNPYFYSRYRRLDQRCTPGAETRTRGGCGVVGNWTLLPGPMQFRSNHWGEDPYWSKAGNTIDLLPSDTFYHSRACQKATGPLFFSTWIQRYKWDQFSQKP